MAGLQADWGVDWVSAGVASVISDYSPAMPAVRAGQPGRVVRLSGAPWHQVVSH